LLSIGIIVCLAAWTILVWAGIRAFAIMCFGDLGAGKIPYADKVCERRKRPVFFWFIFLVHSFFVAAGAHLWFESTSIGLDTWAGISASTGQVVVLGLTGICCIEFGWFLGKHVITGLKTGVIRHTNATWTCSRSEAPGGYWFLVLLFSAMVTGAGWFWVHTLNVIAEQSH